MSLLVPVRRSGSFPWAGFSDLEQHLDRVFNGAARPELREAAWVPAVDIHEEDDAYVLRADLPGMSKDDITVRVLEDRITLKGSRKRHVSEGEEKGYHRYERREGEFERNFRVNGGIVADKVEAHFENGVLTVRLPKPEEVKPRQIEIKSS